jgi:hypothetical protein
VRCGRCNRRLSRHWLLWRQCLRRHGLWLWVRGIGGLRLPGWRHRPGRLRIRRLCVWLALRLLAGIWGSEIWGLLLLLRVPRLLWLRVSLGRLRLRVSLRCLLRVTLRCLLRVTLRRLRRVALLLRLGRITLWRLRWVRWLLRLGVARLLLLLVATRTPGGSRLGPRLPRRWRDRPLLIRRNVGRRGTLKGGLAASKQIQEAPLVDIEVACQVGIGPGPEQALAALEFPEKVEGLARAADPAAAGVGQGAALEGIHPVPARLVQLEHARLGTVDDLVEEAKQADPIDGAERGGRRRLGALLHLALGEELHTAVTGGGRPSLPV